MGVAMYSSIHNRSRPNIGTEMASSAVTQVRYDMSNTADLKDLFLQVHYQSRRYNHRSQMWHIMVCFLLLFSWTWVAAGIFYVIEKEDKQKLFDDTPLIHELNPTNGDDEIKMSDLSGELTTLLKGRLNDGRNIEKIDIFPNGSARIFFSRSSPSRSKWSFSNAFFYTVTTITTIGYGSEVPITNGGKLWTIMIGLVGIPILAMFLSGLAGKMRNHIEKLRRHLFCVEGDGRQMHKKSPLKHRSASLIIVIAFGAFLHILLPSIVFAYVEDWTYVNAVYFVFQTLSTIGFGDILPNTYAARWPWLYRMTLLVWILFGLSYFSVMIGAIQDFLEGHKTRLEEIDHILRERARRNSGDAAATRCAQQDNIDCNSPKPVSRLSLTAHRQQQQEPNSTHFFNQNSTE